MKKSWRFGAASLVVLAIACGGRYENVAGAEDVNSFNTHSINQSIVKKPAPMPVKVPPLQPFYTSPIAPNSYPLWGVPSKVKAFGCDTLLSFWDDFTPVDFYKNKIIVSGQPLQSKNVATPTSMPANISFGDGPMSVAEKEMETVAAPLGGAVEMIPKFVPIEMPHYYRNWMRPLENPFQPMVPNKDVQKILDAAAMSESK